MINQLRASQSREKSAIVPIILEEGFMEQFEKRRDRFLMFESFENPLLNLTIELEVPDFRSRCKELGHSPFHFFLYHLLQALYEIDNFRYRICDGEVYKVKKLAGSYTVINKDNLFNFTRFDGSDDLAVFIARSIEARDIATAADRLINDGFNLSQEELKESVFITSIPWMKFTSIQHPVFKFKSADIPSIAWGRFDETKKGMLSIPFSVQAHHGFVDAYHIYELTQKLCSRLKDF